ASTIQPSRRKARLSGLSGNSSDRVSRLRRRTARHLRMPSLPEITLTVRNYRCFSGAAPATFTMSPGGLTAFVGTNNAGKSMLLRLFYELRPLFAQLGPVQSSAAFQTGSMTFNQQPSLSEMADLFFRGNEDSLTLEVALAGIDHGGDYHEADR